MQLNDFLKAGGPKIRKALEQHLGISKSYLSQLATGRAAISPSRCIVIPCIAATRCTHIQME